MLARARRLLGPDVALIRATLPDLPVETSFDAAICTLDGFTYLAPASPRSDVGGPRPTRSGRTAGSSSTSTPTR